MTVANAADVDTLVHRLARTGNDTAMLEHTERPPLNPEFGIPDHTVFVAVDGEFGYLSHQDANLVRAFPSGDPNSPGYVSEFEEFPHGTGLPLAQLTNAVTEFLVTASRPTSVEWHE